MSGGGNRLGAILQQVQDERLGQGWRAILQPVQDERTGARPPAQYTDFFSLVIRPVIRKITRSAMLVARSAMRSKSWAAQSR